MICLIVYFSVMLFNDKLSHLALSVPDISSHCFQQQQNQYNAMQHQAIQNHNHQIHQMGQWTTASVPTVVQVIPGHHGGNGVSTTMGSSKLNGGDKDKGGGASGGGGGGGGGALLDPHGGGLVLPNHSKANGGWFNGLLGCLRPVWTIIGKASGHDLKHHGNHQSSE